MADKVTIGFKETKEVLDAAIALGQGLEQSLDDGKLNLMDIPNFVSFFTLLLPAIDNVDQVPFEFKISNPEDIAENLKNRGGYVPGIRPGKTTIEYLNGVLTRVTFVGALFLGMIAILPNLAGSITGITSITIGGAGVLIVVSVILETIKKIESQVIMHEYSNVGLN